MAEYPSRQSSVAEQDTCETSKIRKTAPLEGTRRFHLRLYSPTPSKMALFFFFFFNSKGFDKAQTGEYLGEGDELKVVTMHAFVDSMAFRETTFVSAMRNFLQKF